MFALQLLALRNVLRNVAQDVVPVPLNNGPAFETVPPEFDAGNLPDAADYLQPGDTFAEEDTRDARGVAMERLREADAAVLKAHQELVEDNTALAKNEATSVAARVRDLSLERITETNELLKLADSDVSWMSDDLPLNELLEKIQTLKPFYLHGYMNLLSSAIKKENIEAMRRAMQMKEELAERVKQASSGLEDRLEERARAHAQVREKEMRNMTPAEVVERLIETEEAVLEAQEHVDAADTILLNAEAASEVVKVGNLSDIRKDEVNKLFDKADNSSPLNDEMPLNELLEIIEKLTQNKNSFSAYNFSTYRERVVAAITSDITEIEKNSKASQEPLVDAAERAHRRLHDRKEERSRAREHIERVAQSSSGNFWTNVLMAMAASMGAAGLNEVTRAGHKVVDVEEDDEEDDEEDVEEEVDDDEEEEEDEEDSNWWKNWWRRLRPRGASDVDDIDRGKNKKRKNRGPAGRIAQVAPDDGHLAMWYPEINGVIGATGVMRWVSDDVVYVGEVDGATDVPRVVTEIHQSFAFGGWGGAAGGWGNGYGGWSAWRGSGKCTTDGAVSWKNFKPGKSIRDTIRAATSRLARFWCNHVYMSQEMQSYLWNVLLTAAMAHLAYNTGALTAIIEFATTSTPAAMHKFILSLSGTSASTLFEAFAPQFLQQMTQPTATVGQRVAGALVWPPTMGMSTAIPIAATVAIFAAVAYAFAAPVAAAPTVTSVTNAVYAMFVGNGNTGAFAGLNAWITTTVTTAAPAVVPAATGAATASQALAAAKLAALTADAAAKLTWTSKITSLASAMGLPKIMGASLFKGASTVVNDVVIGPGPLYPICDGTVGYILQIMGIGLSATDILRMSITGDSGLVHTLKTSMQDPKTRTWVYDTGSEYGSKALKYGYEQATREAPAESSCVQLGRCNRSSNCVFVYIKGFGAPAKSKDMFFKNNKEDARQLAEHQPFADMLKRIALLATMMTPPTADREFLALYEGLKDRPVDKWNKIRLDFPIQKAYEVETSEEESVDVVRLKKYTIHVQNVVQRARHDVLEIIRNTTHAALNEVFDEARIKLSEDIRKARTELLECIAAIERDHAGCIKKLARPKSIWMCLVPALHESRMSYGEGEPIRCWNFGTDPIRSIAELSRRPGHVPRAPVWIDCCEKHFMFLDNMPGLPVKEVRFDGTKRRYGVLIGEV